MNQYELNIEIEKFITEKDKQGYVYTTSDIEYIKQYSGSGGKAAKGAKGEGLLYEFYTPAYICELMWKLALNYGYDGGWVLEPAVATGNLIANAPNKTIIEAFETNPITARICEISYPCVKVYNNYFETAFLEPPRYTSRIKEQKAKGIFNKPTWLFGYPFSLVIGNPPYGKYASYFSSYFKIPKIMQVEQFFMFYGMQLLKKGGLLVFITSSNFMRNGDSYSDFKMRLGYGSAGAELIDAYRLPPVFESSQVPTDIIVLKRR